jgi:hypothetical protein
MQEVNTIQFQELHLVLRNAQLQRTADLGSWLRHYLESRRRAQLQKEANLSTAVTTLHRSAT